MQESLITMRRKARSPFIYNVLTTYTYCNDRDGVMEFGRRVIERGEIYRRDWGDVCPQIGEAIARASARVDYAAKIYDASAAVAKGRPVDPDIIREVAVFARETEDQDEEGQAEAVQWTCYYDGCAAYEVLMAARAVVEAADHISADLAGRECDWQEADARSLWQCRPPFHRPMKAPIFDDASSKVHD